MMLLPFTVSPGLKDQMSGGLVNVYAMRLICGDIYGALNSGVWGKMRPPMHDEAVFINLSCPVAEC